MIEFLRGPDLWANIIGGFVAALLLTLAAWGWNIRRHRLLQELIEIMGRAIEHRNVGEHRTFTDEKAWVQRAKAIEEQAVAKAQQLSPAAGALVQWLDRVEPWDATSDVKRYVSFLSKVIERIRQILERNA